MNRYQPRPLPVTRRQMLGNLAGGFGSLALASLMNDTAQADGRQLPAPHFAPRAKRVIFLFMSGGPAQMDTFDPKPLLEKYAGKRLPVLESNTNKLLGKARPLGNAFPTPWKFKKYGESGLDVSELFPNVAKSADDLCVVRSMCCDSFFHAQGTLEMMTGNGLFLRPNFGSWLLYGLGSENQNIPGFVVMGDVIGSVDSTKVHNAAFLPAAYQPTHLKSLSDPIPNLRPALASGDQRRDLDALRQLNELHLQRRAEESELEARIQAFELAFRMQTEASEALDLARETKQTQELYGLGTKETDDYGRKCLLARRMVERGVRCVVVNHPNWDQHKQLIAGHTKNAKAVDQPIAGLLQDLKQRGLLEDTLVVWGGEFGRTPNSEGKDGRDHNTSAFTMWLAGGGTKPGYIHGESDEFGVYVKSGRVHVHDFHATLLHLMGLDHERLTYRYSGRDFRLTDVHGNVVTELLA